MRDGVDHETEELLRRWAESERRSRQRRPSGRRARGGALVWAGCGAVTALVAALTLAGAEELGDSEPSGGAAPSAGQAEVRTEAERRPWRTRSRIPSVVAVGNAWRFARERGGDVSLAVVDTAGRLRGRRAGKRYVSASVVKAMLLAAEIRRLERDGLPLDAATQRLLSAMITQSDNDAADSIYLRVGDAGLFEVARLVGMRRFTVAGYWANAQITAADMARYFSRLRSRRLLAGPHRPWALGLLSAVVKEQRWGVPRAAGKLWTVFFKGGWRATEQGQLVHQVALLRAGDRELVIAVLTDGQPSRLHAIHTVRGIADRLLDPGAGRPATPPAIHRRAVTH